MAKAVQLKLHKLNDPIVLDSICSINYLEEKSGIKGRIAGGMGVQSYIPQSLYRETIDLDFSLIWRGSVTEFKELCNPLIEFLKEKGYDLHVHKKRSTYDAFLSKEGDSFVIQHPRRSKKYFEERRKSLERETVNQRIITKQGISYGVLSPEDLTVTKLHRSLIFSNTYNLWIPKYASVEALRNFSKGIKRKILENFAERSERNIALLKLINDCYDLKCLSENVELNSNYFAEVVKDWEGFGQIKSKDFRGLLDKLEIELF